ncbi:MAG: translation initiation factor IF-2 [Desulfobulbus propionicus]|nr:MAG: translation initiation factor IF-2 [Desulfobulbus propionicus]
MSRVRVYELAKDAGLKGKELADKLIAMGYPIKSHSSTVDDDMAADIRRKILEGAVTAGTVEGRIDLKDRSERVKRRTTTVVKRRSKAEKEEALKRLEEEEVAAQEAREAEEQAARMLEAEDPVGEAPAQPETREGVTGQPLESEPDAGRTQEDGPEEVAVERSDSYQDKISEGVADQLQAGEAQTVEGKDESKTVEAFKGEVEDGVRQDNTAPEEATATVASPEEEGTTIEPEQKKAQGIVNAAPRAGKKLAKVVGRVEIPVPEKKTRPGSGRKPGRSGKPSAHQDYASSPVGPGAEPQRSGKGKKKSKRVVAIQNEEEGRSRKMAKSGKKGRSKGGYAQTGDVEFMRPRKGKKRKEHRKEKDVQQVITETKAIKRRIKVVETISVGDLAKRMGIKANEVIAALMKLGVMATLNQSLDLDTAALVAADFGYEVEQAMTEELEVEAFQEQEEEMGGEAVARPPVVTVMGHVDHGKTSILDAIRKTDVAEGEAGGITQHIGAYHVQAPSGDLTFVDTPGHAAFTEMRSRGAKVTDIVVLVVAADDGVMDQTKEAIAHSKAADVPIVVAVNKIDKDNADPERVKRELAEFGLIPEEWGGDTMYCETSAKKGLGINEMLESVQLQAEILELKADPVRKAKGTVIEAQLHKGRGPVATVLVQEGTLRVGDNFVAGLYSGKVRMLINDRNDYVTEAGPAIPVEVQGISGVPSAGDEFLVLSDEKMAKSLSESRLQKARESELASASKVSLDNLFEKMAEQEVKELRVILRADVQGTLQAFGQAAEKLSTSEIKVRVLHEGTGSITENDIHLAAASDAVIIGFNVRPAVKVKELGEREMVDIRSYDVIYHALEDIEKAMVGMLEPTFEERVIGTAEVRDTFQVPKVGTIAGCAVINGRIERHVGVRVLRDGVVIYTGKISSLKRFKDDVKEVLTGYECGIGVENFNDIKLGDNLEAFVLDEVEAHL